MPNTYQPFQIYTNETLILLKNDLVFLKNVNRDNENLFAKKGLKAGSSVSLRYPARFLGRTGENYNAEAYTETSYQVNVRPLQGVDIDLPSTEWTLSLDAVKERVLAPAAAQLRNNIERDCLQLAMQATANSVGTPGVIPNTIKTYNQARAMLVNEGFPDSSKNCVIISPDMQVEIAASVANIFNPQGAISDIWEEGLLNKYAYGFKWYESANLWMQTSGTAVATGGTLNGAPANGATTVAVTGMTPAGGTVKKGTTLSLAVNAVNPMTRQSYGKLRKFTVQADVTLVAGAGNLTISPAITFSGAFANVDAQPAANAPIVLDQAASTTAMAGLAFSPQAYTWACINQEDPSETNAQCYFATDPESGIQLRFVRQFEGRTNNFINRFDVLYAFGTPYPQGAVRVWSLT